MGHQKVHQYNTRHRRHLCHLVNLVNFYPYYLYIYTYIFFFTYTCNRDKSSLNSPFHITSCYQAIYTGELFLKNSPFFLYKPNLSGKTNFPFYRIKTNKSISERSRFVFLHLNSLPAYTTLNFSV